MRNNLDGDIYRANRPLVTHQVHVPAAEVGEAFACLIDDGRVAAVSLVDRERSRYNRDQAGTRMRVPSSVSSWGERVLDDIEVRISLHLRFERPPVLVMLIAHQVEQAIGEESGLRSGLTK